MSLRSICFLIVFVAIAFAKEEREAKCKMTPAYPPDSDRKLDWYEINLDDDPFDRWTEPVTALKDEIIRMVNLVLGSKVLSPFVSIVEEDSQSILDRFPTGYGDELLGIANVTGIEIAKLILYNMAYELFGFCTSIVAQDSNGNVYHGRNLDFGLWPSVNWSDRQWELTQDLRPILFNVNFTKGGETLYKTVAFGGYIGVLTGIRQNAFTVTVDSRYDNNYDKYLLDWLTHSDDQSQFLTFTTRQAIETYDNYADGLSYIEGTSFVGPAYIILGGIEANNGGVVTIGPNMTLLNYWDIPNGLPANDSSVTPWYVLETNYDHWDQPPPFDDRRYPAEDCMNEIGSDSISLETLYNVLNGIPNRNRLTTYTALMDCKEGHLESYRQYCDEPECSPW